MKTLLSFILLTITVSIHFSGIDSSGSSGEGSSRQGSRIKNPLKIKFKKKVPLAPPSPSLSPSPLVLEKHSPQEPTSPARNLFEFHVDPKSSPESNSGVGKVAVTLMGYEIELSYRRTPHQNIPLECKVLGPHVGVPNLEYRKNHDYITCAIYINDLKCVIYMESFKVVLGAKLPPAPNTDLPADDPRLLNPDLTRWYITFEGLDYEVWTDHDSQSIVDVKLKRHNIRPYPEYVRKHGIQTEAIYYNGLFFLRYRNNNNVVVGAEHDRFWRTRPEYATLVPQIDAEMQGYKNNPH